MYPIRVGAELKARGWRVFGLALGGSRVASGMRAAGIEVLEVDSRTQAMLRLPGLIRWLRQGAIDVVHCHKSSDLLLAALLRSMLPFRLFFTEHMGAKRPKKDLLHRWIYGKVDRVLAISDETLKRNRAALPLPPERIQRLWLGTELIRCDEEPLAIRLELGLPDGPLLGMVGRFSRAKGQAELLAAFALLADEFPALRLLLVGGKSATEGADEAFVAELEAQSAREGWQERVFLPGFRRDTARMLRAMDVVIIPSHNEAFGLTVIEAMAAGKPIIGADRGAIPEVLGGAGLLADPLVPAELAARIRELLLSPELAAELASKAGIRAELAFGMSQHLDALSHIYISG